MTDLARTPEQVRADLHEELRWFTETKQEAEARWIRVANAVKEIRDGQYWRNWNYESFDSWLMADCATCRRSIYSLLTVVDRIQLPPAQLEAIGRSKLYEAARVARDKPKEVPALLERLEAEPDLTVEQVKTEVAGILSGLHRGNGYVRMEFLVPAEEAEVVEQALLVARVMSGIADDSPAANGDLLSCMAADFLSGSEQTEILGQIEEARDG